MTEHTIGKICFIGGGNMARALIGGLQTNGYLMSDINVIEPDAEKRTQLNSDFGVSVTKCSDGGYRGFSSQASTTA